MEHTALSDPVRRRPVRQHGLLVCADRLRRTRRLIAKELKQSFPTQILGAVIAVTLPMGLVQGSSSQGNLVVAFWLLVFIVFTLQYFKNLSSVGLVCDGLTFGFVLLSKGTAYALLLPWRPRCCSAESSARKGIGAGPNWCAWGGGSWWR